MLFVDSRDHHGITQIVVETGARTLYRGRRAAAAWKFGADLTGTVAARSAWRRSTLCAATGEIEIYADRGHSPAARAPSGLLLPVVRRGGEYPEEIRLKNRFLDLRCESAAQETSGRASNVILSACAGG